MHNAKFVPNHRNVRDMHVKSKLMPTCHFCGVKGYIRSNCFKLKNAHVKNFLNRNKVQNQLVKKYVILVAKLDINLILAISQKSMASNVGTNLKWVPKYLLTNNEEPKK